MIVRIINANNTSAQFNDSQKLIYFCILFRFEMFYSKHVYNELMVNVNIHFYVNCFQYIYILHFIINKFCL